MSSWSRPKVLPSLRTNPRSPRNRPFPGRFLPQLERLEDRTTPALIFPQTTPLGGISAPPPTETTTTTAAPTPTTTPPTVVLAEFGSQPPAPTGPTGETTTPPTGSTGETPPPVCIPTTPPEEQVAITLGARICHQTSSNSNPYVLLGIKTDNAGMENHLMKHDADIVVKQVHNADGTTGLQILVKSSAIGNPADSTDITSSGDGITTISGPTATALLNDIDLFSAHGVTGHDLCDDLAGRLGQMFGVDLLHPSPSAHQQELVEQGLVAVGADAGGGPQVVVSDSSGKELFRFFAYDQNFGGGVRVALGDVNGDGVPDIITAPGKGGGPDIRFFDGASGHLLRQFFAFGTDFRGGAFVASGDVDGDGIDDCIVGAGAGGGPNVLIVSGADGSVLRNFFAFGKDFAGGVRVAAGDIDGDGGADVIAGAGKGGGPNVCVFSGDTGHLLTSFFAGDLNSGSGVFVAAGDTTGDGHIMIVTGSGDDQDEKVQVFDSCGAVVQDFAPFPDNGHDHGQPGLADKDAADNDHDGVRVAVVKDKDGKGRIVAAEGFGKDSSVKKFHPGNQEVDDVFAFGHNFKGGCFVGG